MASNGLSGSGGSPAPGPAAPQEARLTRWQKFRMVVKVVELRLRFIALMAVTGLVFAYWDTLWNYYEKWTRPPGAAHVAASDFEFFCPMHPTVVQETPGSCPICGMPLSKRKKGEQESLPEGVTSRLTLSPERIAQAGIETVAVDYRPLTETVTTVGAVAFDERRLARISSKTKGMARVEELFVNFTGTRVEAGEPLAELYSPELYQAIRELLIAQQSAHERSRLQSPAASQLLSGGDLVALSREKLARWGITPKQVDEILTKGKTDYRVSILSPISGVVVRKNVVEGQYVAEGEAMFEVADLSRVWILAQVYESRIGLVQVGQEVEATVKAYPGEVFKGTVAFKAPALNSSTRTLDVRYDLENPDGRLQPGMYATVTLKTPVAEMPAFRTRLAAERSQGDLSRVASLTVEQQERCLVTNAKLGSMGDPIPVAVAGKQLWICCAGCEEKLKGTPDKYLAKLAPAPQDAVLTVPESAVIDTGTRQVVFIEAEPGVFEGREVVLGPPSGDFYPVLEGLAPGERVAAAGSFLLDAETRLKASSGPPPATESTDPHKDSHAKAVASSDPDAPPVGGHRH